ncbi:MAG: V-type ATP synthase subunit D [Dehalococcoidales bacterium]
MAQILTVRPTKIELIRLKRRYVLAKRIKRIIKDRLSILMLEFLQTVRETVEVRKRMIDEFPLAYKMLSVSAGFNGYTALEKEFIASTANSNLSLTTGCRYIAGTRVPSLELNGIDYGSYSYSMTDTSAVLDKTTDQFKKCLETLVALAELQSTMDTLGHEINQIKRVVNALDNIIIPNLEETIKFLSMKFEERNREEKTRLKLFKAMLDRKSQQADE